ncbi:hypothetical protein VNO77_26023 [Canavalia gladiata]|uniref:Uncharacterized protein n=1 Tax=Canavalia gladiata TaxID=3824 RepID=A0AAN9KSI6_CANGL
MKIRSNSKNIGKGQKKTLNTQEFSKGYVFPSLLAHQANKDQKLQLIIIYTNHSIAQTHIFKNKVSKFQLMALFSFFNCFGTPHSSGQVSDYAEGSQLKSSSSEKSKSKPKSKGAPIVVSYFPVNHYPSRL